ncbi:MAG: putative rane protein, partial [Solirubrobacterales bacterium]|nr:putative rane protein [Solirubrobacterales bacterium]
MLPRPGDLFKAWILPLTFVVGLLSTGAPDGRSVVRAVLVWLVLELLIYQARYQWNDIRGFHADLAHPDASSRGRLPGPAHRARAHVRASRLVMGARLATAACLALALRTLDVGRPLLLLAVAVFGAAFAYEWLRSTACGRTDRVPPPVRPGLLAIWIVIGAGYAIRGATGLLLALHDPSLAVIVTAALTMWAFGIAFVTARWTLEALAFARTADDGLAWEVRSQQAREHTLALVRWLPAGPPQDRAGGPVPPQRWPALAGVTAWQAPWNLAIL